MRASAVSRTVVERHNCPSLVGRWHAGISHSEYAYIPCILDLRGNLLPKMISQKHALSLTVAEGAPFPENVEAVFSLEAQGIVT